MLENYEKATLNINMPYWAAVSISQILDMYTYTLSVKGEGEGRFDLECDPVEQFGSNSSASTFPTTGPWGSSTPETYSTTPRTTTTPPPGKEMHTLSHIKHYASNRT